MSTDNVNGRQEGGDHYLGMGLQPWKIIDSWSYDQAVGFYKGNVLKYLLRAGQKNGVSADQDLAKAIHYLQKLQELVQNRSPDSDLLPPMAAPGTPTTVLPTDKNHG